MMAATLCLMTPKKKRALLRRDCHLLLALQVEDLPVPLK